MKIQAHYSPDLSLLARFVKDMPVAMLANADAQGRLLSQPMTPLETDALGSLQILSKPHGAAVRGVPSGVRMKKQIQPILPAMALLLAALGLPGCERATVVQVPAAPAPPAVAGPAGPPGEAGKPGDTTVVVVPMAASAPASSIYSLTP